METDMSFKRFMLGAVAGAVSLAAWARVDNPWTYHESDDGIGRIYYYERTNTDGSMDERVTVFRRDATHIEVYKENGPACRVCIPGAEPGHGRRRHAGAIAGCRDPQ
jgi:hypothetical protein